MAKEERGLFAFLNGFVPSISVMYSNPASIGDVNHKPLFVDDEFDESGLPNYVGAGGGRVE